MVKVTVKIMLITQITVIIIIRRRKKINNIDHYFFNRFKNTKNIIIKANLFL